MKLTFAKVLGLTLALALVLSGCNLIEIDAKMQADEDIAKIDERYAATVASYDGGEVTAAEVVGDFYASYSEMAYMYQYFGMELTHEQEHEIIETTLSDRVRAEISAAHFDEAYSLSDEDLADVESRAQSDYESNLSAIEDGVEGETDEQRSENVRVLLRANGMDYDRVYENAVLDTKASSLLIYLRDEITELTDEELQAAYDEKVAEQKESFTDGHSFESAMSNDSEIVCWMPDGYRTVKHILLVPSDEVKEAYTTAVSELSSAQSDLDSLNEELEAANDGTDEEGERTPEEIQTEIDAIEAELPNYQSAVESAAQDCLDDVKDTTDEIYARLEAGDSFDDLIAEYGEDPGMESDPAKTSGYYVSSESTSWEVNFRDASMALEQVGDYSAEPVVSGSGVHIIQYTGDVLGGEVELAKVHDALYDETLEARKDAHATEVVDGWVEAANPSYDVDAFEKAISGT